MHKRALVVVVASAACQRDTRLPPDVVARSTDVSIDGDWDEHAWSHGALRGRFVDEDGKLARPSSEIRLLHDDRELFVALYAADEDIESRDAFELSVGQVALRVDARGNVSVPGVRARSGFDEGTIDDPHDDDEEWVVELAIPLARVGAAPLSVKASRCDTPKDGHERCGRWAGSVRLE